MKGITTVYDSTGYILRPRRRLRDLSLITIVTKSIFNIPTSRTAPEQKLKKYYSSKLALPVTRVIDDYNYYIGGVDRFNQLRKHLSVKQITR